MITGSDHPGNPKFSVVCVFLSWPAGPMHPFRVSPAHTHSNHLHPFAIGRNPVLQMCGGSRADVSYLEAPSVPTFLFPSSRPFKDVWSRTQGTLPPLQIPRWVSFREEMQILSRSQFNSPATIPPPECIILTYPRHTQNPAWKDRQCRSKKRLRLLLEYRSVQSRVRLHL